VTRLPGSFESGATRSSSRVADRGSRGKGLLATWGSSQDGPIGPSQQANPQDSPPTASRHPARAAALAEEFDDERDARPGSLS
jgi:hypothetical protein